MSLTVYSAPTPSSGLSVDGAFTNPLRISFNGTTGAVKIFKYWVRNDDELVYYQDITVTPVSTSDPNVVSNVNGFGWQLIAGDTEPLDDEWGLTSYGNTIDITDIGDPDTNDGETYLYIPFFARVTVPRLADVYTYHNVTLRIAATENSF
jgi:hypothetical protein